MGKTGKKLQELETYLAANNFLGAATVVELGLEKQPDSMDLALTLAYALFHAQKYSKARPTHQDDHHRVPNSTCRRWRSMKSYSPAPTTPPCNCTLQRATFTCTCMPMRSKPRSNQIIPSLSACACTATTALASRSAPWPALPSWERVLKTK